MLLLAVFRIASPGRLAVDARSLGQRGGRAAFHARRKTLSPTVRGLPSPAGAFGAKPRCVTQGEMQPQKL